MEIYYGAVLLLFTALSALFSGSEAALFSLNRLQLRQIEGEGSRTARSVGRLLASPQHLLSSLLVGNTLVNIAIPAIITSLAIRHFGRGGVQIAILISSVLILLGGEILPKTIAVNFPRGFSRIVSIPLSLLLYLLRPLTWIANTGARGLLRLLGQTEAKEGSERRVTPSELRAAFEEIDDGAGMSKLESRLVQNILFFPKTTAEEVMTPRVDIVAAPVTATAEELRDLIESSKHSRIPLYEKTLDSIVGHLSARSFLLDPATPIARLIRPVLVVPEKAPIDRIFQDLRKGRWRMAVVVNEYGETVGLFTQEDLIEEVIGELSDEYERAVEEEIVRREKNVLEVRGRASLTDLGAALGRDLPQDQAVTVSGFLCALYGGFPRPGTLLRWGGLEFEVLEVARHRVQKVRVRLAEREGER
jgi:CBS domain containing-hemolysin-like protein